MAGLKPIYKMVAREMALGIDLTDICEARGLVLASMQRVCRGELFKVEIAKIQESIDQEIINKAAEDPVLAKLQGLSYRAVGVLGDEMDNYDQEAGGTATTRISASKAVLDKAGYSGKGGEGESKVIILSLSEAKLAAVKKVELNTKLVEEVPDCVDGHLLGVGT